jgi:hypothetical protein
VPGVGRDGCKAVQKVPHGGDADLKFSLKAILVIIGVLAVIMSCHSRLKPRLYQVGEESRLRLEYVDSYWLDNFTLSRAEEGDPLIPGEGKVLICNQKRTDPNQAEIETGLLTAVGEINYRIYVDLPDKITTGSLNLKNKSICRIIGMYEIDDRVKHYECREGYLKIDTVKTNRFHAQLYGKYFNYKNDSLVFDGDLNVKEKK